MQFNDTYITTAGLQLLSQALSGNVNDQINNKSIIWGKIETSNLDTAPYSIGDMNALTSITINGSSVTSSGNVITAVTNPTANHDKTVTLNCEINNITYGNGYAKTLGIWAKLAEDDNYTLVVVARPGTGVNPEFIPSVSSELFRAFIDLYLNVSDDSTNTITAPSSFYASSQAFMALADRVVTTHIAGNLTTGESQNIYGTKSFKDESSFDGEVTFNHVVWFENNATFSGSTTFAVQTHFNDGLTTNIIYGNGTNNTLNIEADSIEPTYQGVNLGASANPWSVVYADHIGYTTAHTSVHTKDVRFGDNTYAESFTHTTAGVNTVRNLTPLNEGIAANCDFIPKTHNTFNLGESNLRWNNLYSNNIQCNNLTVSTSATIDGSCTSATELNNNNNTITYSSSPISSWKSNISIIPSADYTYNLGYYVNSSSKYRWNYIFGKYLGDSASHFNTAYIDTIESTSVNATTFTGDLVGKIPTATGSGTSVLVDVGSIFLAVIEYSGNSYYYIGGEINVTPSSSWKVKVAQFRASSGGGCWEASNYGVPANATYKLLSSLNLTASSSSVTNPTMTSTNTALALVMRIS